MLHACQICQIHIEFNNLLKLTLCCDQNNTIKSGYKYGLRAVEIGIDRTHSKDRPDQNTGQNTEDRCMKNKSGVKKTDVKLAKHSIKHNIKHKKRLFLNSPHRRWFVSISWEMEKNIDWKQTTNTQLQFQAALVDLIYRTTSKTEKVREKEEKRREKCPIVTWQLTVLTGTQLLPRFLSYTARSLVWGDRGGGKSGHFTKCEWSCDWKKPPNICNMTCELSDDMLKLVYSLSPGWLWYSEIQTDLSVISAHCTLLYAALYLNRLRSSCAASRFSGISALLAGYTVRSLFSLFFFAFWHTALTSRAFSMRVF